MKDELLTTKEAAKELRISMSTFWKLVRNEKLKTARISERKVGVLRSEVNRFMEDLK